MFCDKCGASNSEEAVYCQKCGASLAADEATVIAKNTTSSSVYEEKTIFSIRPTLKFVEIGYVAAVIFAFLLVAILVRIDSMFDWRVAAWIFVLAGISLLLIPAYFHLKQKTILYTLTDAKIEIDEGFIFQNSRNIPLRSIQDVSVTSTIWQRLMGFGNLVIDNASEDGGKVILRNINTPKKYADLLLKEMRLLDK